MCFFPTPPRNTADETNHFPLPGGTGVRDWLWAPHGSAGSLAHGRREAVRRRFLFHLRSCHKAGPAKKKRAQYNNRGSLSGEFITEKARPALGVCLCARVCGCGCVPARIRPRTMSLPCAFYDHAPSAPTLYARAARLCPDKKNGVDLREIDKNAHPPTLSALSVFTCAI